LYVIDIKIDFPGMHWNISIHFPSSNIQDLATYFVYATNVVLHATPLNKHPSKQEGITRMCHFYCDFRCNYNLCTCVNIYRITGIENVLYNLPVLVEKFLYLSFLLLSSSLPET